MGPIQEARFINFAERQDVKYADVEVNLSGRETPLLASFSLRGGNVELAHVYSKEPSHELDWYDNNLHQAYQDLTAEIFDNGRGELGLGSREDFAEAVLSFPDVRQALAPYLS